LVALGLPVLAPSFYCLIHFYKRVPRISCDPSRVEHVPVIVTSENVADRPLRTPSDCYNPAQDEAPCGSS